MAKKKSNNKVSKGSSNAAYVARKTQEQADKRIRNIIIAVVMVVIVAIIATLALVIVSQNNSAKAETLPVGYDQGEPIIVSHLGVGKSDPELEDLTLNYSYTCHGCTALETQIGSLLSAGATDGKYNLILQPVNTAYMEFQGPATNAALTVASMDPENFVLFHRALMMFADGQINTEQSTAIVGSLNASAAQVAKIAREIGISDDIIAEFDKSAKSYLTASTLKWSEETVTGRTPPATTPELVVAGTKLDQITGTSDEVYDSLIEQMTTLTEK